MKNKYRILEKNGIFYPQYYKNSWLRSHCRWVNFTRRVPPISIDVWFKTLEEAKQYLCFILDLNSPKEPIIHEFYETKNP